MKKAPELSIRGFVLGPNGVQYWSVNIKVVVLGLSSVSKSVMA